MILLAGRGKKWSVSVSHWSNKSHTNIHLQHLLFLTCLREKRHASTYSPSKQVPLSLHICTVDNPALAPHRSNQSCRLSAEAPRVAAVSAACRLVRQTRLEISFPAPLPRPSVYKKKSCQNLSRNHLSNSSSYHATKLRATTSFPRAGRGRSASHAGLPSCLSDSFLLARSFVGKDGAGDMASARGPTSEVSFHIPFCLLSSQENHSSTLFNDDNYKQLSSFPN